MNCVITGLDGCGKDTQIQNVKLYSQSIKISFTSYSIWDCFYHFKNDTVQARNILNIILKNFSPWSRSLFLQSLLIESETMALSKNSKLSIFNAGFIKYAASEITLGSTFDIWNNCLKLFKKPDLVIYLKCSLNSIRNRKVNLSEYEKPLWDHLDSYEKNFETILSYFSNVKIINGDETPEEVFEIIKSEINLINYGS